MGLSYDMRYVCYHPECGSLYDYTLIFLRSFLKMFILLQNMPLKDYIIPSLFTYKIQRYIEVTLFSNRWSLNH